MKDIYEDVNAFIKNVMPIEYRKLKHRETSPEKYGSDSTAYKFEEKLEKILSETDESKSHDMT